MLFEVLMSNMMFIRYLGDNIVSVANMPQVIYIIRTPNHRENHADHVGTEPLLHSLTNMYTATQYPNRLTFPRLAQTSYTVEGRDQRRVTAVRWCLTVQGYVSIKTFA